MFTIEKVKYSYSKILIYIALLMLMIFIIAASIIFASNLGSIDINERLKSSLVKYMAATYILTISSTTFILFRKRRLILKKFEKLSLHYKLAIFSSISSLSLVSKYLIEESFNIEIFSNAHSVERVMWCINLALSLYWIISKAMILWIKLGENQKLAIKTLLLLASPSILLINDTFSSTLINEIFGVSSEFFPKTERFITIFITSIILQITLTLLMIMYCGMLMIKSMMTKKGTFTEKVIIGDLLISMLSITPLYTISNWIDNNPTQYIKDFSTISDFNTENSCLFNGMKFPAIVIDERNSYAIVSYWSDNKKSTFPILKCELTYIKKQL